MTDGINMAFAVFTAGFGLFGLLMPQRAAVFVGLKATLPAGQSEFRATFGGLFVALGLAPLLLGAPGAYAVAGLAWAGTSLGRLISIVLDKTSTPKNWSGVVLEALMAAGLLIGAPLAALTAPLP